MEKFKIVIEETLSKVVEVEATTVEDALNKVEDMYRSCEVVLYPEDFIDVEFTSL